MATVRALDAVTLDGESAEQALHRFLSARRLLLVIDNCERLPGVAAFDGGVLSRPAPESACSQPAASRWTCGPRRATRSHRCRCTTMPSSSSPSAGGRRTRSWRRTDAAFAEICARLDGLPLAIELAAARCSLLTPAEIARRLHTALGALGAGARDAPERRRTLRATIDWSYDLLDDDERTAFSRFAVFAGGATVDAVEAVTGADLDMVDRLVDKSLVIERHGAETRLAMLETIREYAGESFAASADAEVMSCTSATSPTSSLRRTRGQRPRALRRRSQGASRRARCRLENLHAALGWAVARGDPEPAVAMCAALARFWRMRHRHADGIRWIRCERSPLKAPKTIAPCKPARS